MYGPSRDKIPLSRGYPQLVQVRGILGQKGRGQRGSEGHIQREGGGWVEEGAVRQSGAFTRRESWCPGLELDHCTSTLFLKTGSEVGCDVY